MTVVSAETAEPAFRLLGESGQGVPVQKRADLPRGRLAPAAERRAVSSHQARDVRTDHLHAHFLLKGPQNRLIIKRPALDHHIPAQFFRAGGANDLIDGVFHHRNGQSGGNILNACPVLLGLFYAGIHKDRTAAAQIHGTVREQTQLCKILHVVAQRLGKGLQKAPAAGGTGFIEENIADGSVLDLEALHILTADVNDKIHIGQEVSCGGEVGHGFHHAVIPMKGVLGEILPVARRCHGSHVQRRMFVVKPLQHAADQGDGIA